MNRALLSTSFTVLTAVISMAATADVTMTQKFELEAGGSMANLESQGTVTTYVSGDRGRTESNMKSEIVGMTQANTMVEIDRLDRGVNWRLQEEKRQFSEMTYAEKREQFRKDQAQATQSNGLPVSEEDCEWSNPRMDVQHPGKRQRFANIKGEQHIIIAEETCVVPSSGQTCVVSWIMETWMAKRMPGVDELRSFRSNVARESGLGDMMTDMPASGRGMVSMFEEGWEDVMDEMMDLEGYPVKTIMQMEMSGDACTSVSGQPIAMDEVWGNAADAGVKAGANTAGYHARWAAQREASRAMGGGASGSIAGQAVGAATGEVVSGLLRHFGEKKKTEPEPTAEPTADSAPASGPGPAIVFRLSSELTAIDDKLISRDQFEIPVGWKKVSAIY